MMIFYFKFDIDMILNFIFVVKHILLQICKDIIMVLTTKKVTSNTSIYTP